MTEWTQADSDAFERFGYDADTRTLSVVFKGGNLYTYSDVPPEIYQGRVDAPSEGNYFRTIIKGKFTHSRGG